MSDEAAARPWWSRRPAIVAAGVVLIIAGALALRLMGHPWVCPCGTVKLWGGIAAAGENSQHILDWYTLSHIVHGLLFYFLVWLVFRRLPAGTRFLIALLLEVAWEIVEGTPALIERYRGATVAIDYFGDSVINSVADSLTMVLGYWLAARLPIWASLMLAVALEAAAALVIRDNLTLNVLMLVWPIEAIKIWQGGG